MVESNEFWFKKELTTIITIKYTFSLSYLIFFYVDAKNWMMMRIGDNDDV